MKTFLIGLGALSLSLGFAPTTQAQSITITTGPMEVSPDTNDSYWVWNDEYQCWVWTGPEFRGDWHGHPYSYWHGRHEGDDRHHRPVGEHHEGEHHEGEHHEGEHHEGDHHEGDHHEGDHHEGDHHDKDHHDKDHHDKDGDQHQ